MRLRLIAPIGMICIAGCVGVPDYRTPQPATAATGAFVSTSQMVDPASAAPDSWWLMYDDDTLSKLVAEAFERNADLKVAVANLSISRAVLEEARAGRYPSTQTSAGVQYGRNLIADSLAASAHKSAGNVYTYLGGFDVSYEVDLFGRVARSIEAASDDADASEAARDAVRVLVAAETTRAYTTIRSLGHELEVARRSVDLADESIAIVERQAAAGAASDFDVARTRVLADQARSQLPALEGRRRAAVFELTALLGRFPADAPWMTTTAEAARPQILLSLPVGDGERLLARRPDVRQSERRLAAASARVGVATASLYPRVNLGASVGVATNDLLKGSNAVTLSLGPLVSWTFPDRAVARSRIAQSNAATEAALGNFDATVLRALKEVEQAITACDAEGARRLSLASAEANATTAYRLSKVRRREGVLSRLDLLTAEQTLLGARAALASSETRLVDAQVSLFKALGGGWKDAKVAALDSNAR